MSGAGNDFIIVDQRNINYHLNQQKIALLSTRNVIGCDQFIILKKSDEADCLMEIYNSDGSISGACGNATRCVADILMTEKNIDEIIIKTSQDLLKCYKDQNNIAVEMSKPKFFVENFIYEGYEFFLADVGNPHAVCFLDEMLDDEKFFKIAKAVESHKFFKNKTNVEFVKIINNQLAQVRVFERGSGETLACGTGACAVGALAIKNKFITGNNIELKFKGGIIKINWQPEEKIIMSGDATHIFNGNISIDLLKKI